MKTKVFFIAVGFFFTLWAAGFAWFLSQSTALQPETPTQETDAIVVLTGGNQRIENGLALFSSGLSKHLFITGVHPDVSMEKILSLWSGPEELPECCITLGHMAVSTFQNAQETREWIEQNEIKSIRLVTADYHMIRSEMEFLNALPGIKIIRHPVHQKDLDTDHLRFIRVFLSEYNKTLIRFAQQLFEPQTPLSKASQPT